MSPQGYLHNEMDVKVLILFILARIETPLDVDEIYEVAYQDESLNYFMLANCLHELKLTGHVTTEDGTHYTITAKGKKQGSYVEDSLALPVVEKVSVSIQAKIDQIRRDSLLKTQVHQDENGVWIATLHYRDNELPLMSISLFAPNREHAYAMAENMRKHNTLIYKTAMDAATNQEKYRRKKHDNT